jgi:hypothetical protein
MATIRPVSQRSRMSEEVPIKKKARTSLAGITSVFPTTFSPYWRRLPLGRMKMFLAGYFFVGGAGGFALDLLQLNASLVWGGFF